MSLSETEPTTNIVFGKDYPSRWAEIIGINSGIYFKKQIELELFRELRLRDKNPDSDQVVYAKVLERTGGPVDAFKAKYPYVVFPSELEIENY